MKSLICGLNNVCLLNIIDYLNYNDYNIFLDYLKDYCDVDFIRKMILKKEINKNVYTKTLRDISRFVCNEKVTKRNYIKIHYNLFRLCHYQDYDYNYNNIVYNRRSQVSSFCYYVHLIQNINSKNKQIFYNITKTYIRLVKLFIKEEYYNYLSLDNLDKLDKNTIEIILDNTLNNKSKEQNLNLKMFKGIWC
jgi:hypothetical protein